MLKYQVRINTFVIQIREYLVKRDMVKASQDVIVAGILHDTIEDCQPYGFGCW